MSDKKKKEEDKKEKNTERTEKELSGKPFKEGYDPRRNYKGRPKGSKDFKTKFYEFVEKVADKNDTEVKHIEEELLRTAFERARNGDFRFWKDLQDRIYGKAVRRTDLTTQGEKITSEMEEHKQLLIKLLGEDAETETSTTDEEAE